MKRFNNLEDIRDAIQILDTPVLQWLDSSPAGATHQQLENGRKKLAECSKICDLPLRIAMFGEEGANPSSLLNAIFDCADFFPETTFDNILEIRVNLVKDIDGVKWKRGYISRREEKKAIPFGYKQFKNNFVDSDIVIEELASSIKKIHVEIDTWGVPLGMDSAYGYHSLVFTKFPTNIEAFLQKNSTLSSKLLGKCHAVLVALSPEYKSLQKTPMAEMLQSILPQTPPRVLVVVNEFERFKPVPAEVANLQQYFQHENEEQNDFASLLISTEKVLKFAENPQQLYLCSPINYLFEARTKRSNWQFGNAKWFAENHHQSSYSLYKRVRPEFEKYIYDISKNKNQTDDYLQMRFSLERYVDGAGVPALREKLMCLIRDAGEQVIKERALKKLRVAYGVLDEVAPQERGNASAKGEVAHIAQEFYRILELAIVDNLPAGPSGYKNLRIQEGDDDITLWDKVEKEIALRIAAWPEWFSIINQRDGDTDETPKKFGRYSKLKKADSEVPREFKVFDKRFSATAEIMCESTVEKIKLAVGYSVERFEKHPDYQKACEDLKAELNLDKLPELEEALPLLDIWQPSQLVQDDLVPEIIKRIEDELDSLKNVRHPYDGEKPCFWSLALVIRIQVQLLKTLRDKVSRVVAAAENEFQNFFIHEVLRREILPLVRACLNDNQFLATVTSLNNNSQNSTTKGQLLRNAVEEVKQMDSMDNLGLHTEEQALHMGRLNQDENELENW